MNWREIYRNKICSPQEAAKKIQSNDIIVTGMTNAIPYAVLDCLYDEIDHLRNVRIDMGFGNRAMRLYLPDARDKVTVRSLFLGPIERAFLKKNSNIEVQLIHLSSTSKDRSQVHPANIAMMVGTPPNDEGQISFGLCPLDKSLLLQAEKVIIQVNENMPFVQGEDITVHVDQVTHLVDLSEPLYSPPPFQSDEADNQIAAYIAEQIPDGACIQLGIGGLATAVGHLLREKKDLGIHTEMFVEPMVDLIECGAVNNSRKQLLNGISVFGFALGSQRMYAFLDQNPAVLSRSFAWVNDPFVIAQNDHVISVNGALAIDLTGQVCAESIGSRHYSGTGGQLDFVRGANQSRGGKSFIAMPSTRTDKGGNLLSKISLALPVGSAVTTPRADVDYIVTEYGIARLKNETIENRARALIKLSHPAFRDELTFEAKKAGFF